MSQSVELAGTRSLARHRWRRHLAQRSPASTSPVPTARWRPHPPPERAPERSEPAPGAAPVDASASRNPIGSSRPTGWTSPAIDESPTAWGSANETNSSVSSLGCHTAREPTADDDSTATSTSARCRRGTVLDDEDLVWPAGLGGFQRPGGDQSRGQADDGGLTDLHEGVVRPGGDRSQREVSCGRGHQSDRAVAAEHDQHTHAESHQSAGRGDRIDRPAGQREVQELELAATVDPARDRGHLPPAPARRQSQPGRPRPHTRWTPTAPSEASTRCSIITFSVLGNTDAGATSRRMSWPERGLTIKPTSDSPGRAGLMSTGRGAPRSPVKPRSWRSGHLGGPAPPRARSSG